MFLVVAMFGSVKQWDYVLKSPLVGEIGKASIIKEIRNKHYTIKIYAQSEGIVKFLTGRAKYMILSKGVVSHNDYLQSHLFHIQKRSSKKSENIDYKFNYSQKIITKYKIEWKRGKLDKNITKRLKFFTTFDLANIYFNIVSKASKNASYLAAGAEKVGGKIFIQIPSKDIADKERDILNVSKDTKIVYIVVPKKLKGKSNRKVVIAISKDGMFEKAYTVAVPVVGKIYIERVK